MVFLVSGMAGRIIQSGTGAEEFVLLNKEAATVAFSLYIPVQIRTQIQMHPVQIQKQTNDFLLKYKSSNVFILQGKFLCNTTTDTFSLYIWCAETQASLFIFNCQKRHLLSFGLESASLVLKKENFENYIFAHFTSALPKD